MRICYVLLSPTFGMHQYTADLANRMACSRNKTRGTANHEVHLVTTENVPRDRYAPEVEIHAPLVTTNTGFSSEGLRLNSWRPVYASIRELRPDLVHFTGVHLWNVSLVHRLRRQGLAVIHTLHDLDPHRGRRFGALIRLWNELLLKSDCHILVHGECYQERIIASGLEPQRVTSSPLLCLCFGWDRELALHEEMSAAGRGVCDSQLQYDSTALFFGRMELYKGVQPLLAASALLGSSAPDAVRVVMAGPGALGASWSQPLPPGVELRNRHIGDEEALVLLRRCGLLVLPYVDATQSGLVALAYFFCKPVIATRSGALPEYVQHGRTGWLVEPGDVVALARCLDEALSDPARLERLGRAGRAWYEAKRKQESDTLMQMYEEVARRDGDTQNGLDQVNEL